MAVPSPFPADKVALRRDARAQRRAFIAANPGRRWMPGGQEFEQWFDRGVPYASYRPIGSEADPEAIERIADGRHNMIRSYPRVDGDGAMRFYAPTRRGFVRDVAGIEAPAEDAALILPAIVFAPLLAFDRQGTRLGQGGGHYDRALARLRGELAERGWRLRVIGVAWAVQEVDQLPRDPWDIPLNGIVTEKEWILTS